MTDQSHAPSRVRLFLSHRAERLAAAILFLGVSAGAAAAHITLETGQAHVGSPYKAVLRVGHGCAGKPTVALRVKIPEGMIAAEPMPKPGWTVDEVRGGYARTYDYRGTPLSGGVTEIAWRGGSLPSREHGEFVLSGFLAADLPAGGTLFFPVVQECADGATDRWIEIPTAGQSGDSLEFPAPGVKLLEKAAGH